MALDGLHGKNDLPLTALDWLLTHHRAKEAERRFMVRDLGLDPAARVLDLGCGPGLWTSLIAEVLGPEGKVVGLDFDPALITFAQKSLDTDSHADRIEYQLGDFNDLPYGDGSFDAIFFGNCFCYVPDPMVVLREKQRVVRPGGRVITKDFDGGVFIAYPVDSVLLSEVQLAVDKGLAQRAITHKDDPSTFFDNHFGRKALTLFMEAGFRECFVRSYALQMTGPLTLDQQRYIAVNARWMASMAGDFLADASRERWLALFDTDGADCILARPDIYFVMLETVTTGIV